jgi:Ca2+-binding EF-hand superfamily protein
MNNSKNLSPEVRRVAAWGPKGTSGTSTEKIESKVLPALGYIITRLKTALREHGAHGFIGLQRKFRIMDDDGSKSLSFSEWKKGMNEMDIELNDAEMRNLFHHFDKDSDGYVNFEEFIQGVRDPLSPNRQRLINMAFSVLDKDGNGIVEASEIAGAYDASQHPDVIAGRKTQTEVYGEFLNTFDVGGEVDGKVTRQEFENYYHNISASIDNEDYFELMIRNAWHISGGEGWAANTSNKRVLVTHADGTQSVEEIKDDLGMKAGDQGAAIAKLRKQGLQLSHIDLAGNVNEDTVPGLSTETHKSGRKTYYKLHGASSAPVGVLPGKY